MGEGNVAARRADFRDDLLRGIDAEAGDLGEALHRVVVGREQVGHLLIELAEVILDHAQFFERELQQPTVDRMQRRTRLEGIAQLLGRGAQARGREGREGGRIGLAIRQRLQHAAGTDAEQVRHEAGHLDVRFLEQRLQSVLELHAIPGDLVLAAHHGAPEPLLGVGHEAQGELLRDQAFHQPLRIREVLLASAGPRFDCAWARWSVPASRGAPSRARRRGRQCCSRASHTGRQYCAVDSMTTSSTSCSTSQSARRADRPASCRPSGARSGSRRRLSTSATTTASIFLWTSIPAIRYGIGLSSGSGERASSHQSGSRAIAGRSRSPHDAQLFSQSRTLRTKQLLGLNGSTGLIRSRRSRRAILARADFHRLSRAAGPGSTSCGNRPVRRASCKIMKSTSCERGNKPLS